MIKNEIEYMHAKIDGIQSEEDIIGKDDSNKVTKQFQTGAVGLSLIQKEAKKD
jgi:hypothetical protein